MQPNRFLNRRPHPRSPDFVTEASGGMTNSTYESVTVVIWINKAWPCSIRRKRGHMLLPVLIRQVIPKTEANSKDELWSEVEEVLLECLLPP